MDGEIDLKLYTISIIKLNNALEKLYTSDINEIKILFNESLNDLEQFYKNTVNDLNNNKININEYYLFFQNGKQTFPQYIKLLESIDNSQIRTEINSIIQIFKNFNKISDAFPKKEMIK